jgi:hypothetical protein
LAARLFRLAQHEIEALATQRLADGTVDIVTGIGVQRALSAFDAVAPSRQRERKNAERDERIPFEEGRRAPRFDLLPVRRIV